MTATVDFPTLRLGRWRMENLMLGAMKPGQVRELSDNEWAQLLRRLKLK